MQQHTSAVIPSSIKAKVHTHIWYNICLQENISSDRNTIKLFYKMIWLASQYERYMIHEDT